MILHTDFEQGSQAWLDARAGIPTSSEFGNLVTPTGEVRKGQMVESYLALKTAEAWLGGPIGSFTSWSMDQGEMRQEEALNWLAADMDCEIERVGLCTSDDGKIGASPDGLILDREIGVEVKCPEARNQVSYLLAGKVPPDYVPQVQGGMFVTGFSKWIFISYRRNFPKLVITVDRDEKFQSALSEALSAFTARLDSAVETLRRLNGGKMPKRIPIMPTLRPIKTQLAEVTP